MGSTATLTRPCALLLLLLVSGCGPAAEPPDGGGRCAADDECAAGVCRLDPDAELVDLDAAPLACGAPRGEGAQGERCAEVRDCRHGLCAAGGTCVTPCDSAAGCAPHERCAELVVRVADDAMQTVEACVARWQVPAGVSVESARFPAALEQGRVALAPWAETGMAVLLPSRDVRLRVETVTTDDAAARVLFDRAAITDGGDGPANGVDPFAQPTAVFVPNGAPRESAGDGLEVAFTARDPVEADDELEVLTLARAGRGAVLDLDVFYVGALDWAPEGTRGPAPLEEALVALEVTLVSAGITLGEVRQHEIVGGLRDEYAIVDREAGGWPESRALFRLSAGAAGPSLSLFLVRMVEQAAGLSGGTPGAHGLPGEASSGVALGVDTLDLGTLAPVLAHEVAHFLGLFHTSELDGAVYEPIDDTPACGSAWDADGDGVLAADECVGRGATNLMFWAGGPATLTAGQADVLGRALLLR